MGELVYKDNVLKILSYHMGSGYRDVDGDFVEPSICKDAYDDVVKLQGIKEVSYSNMVSREEERNEYITIVFQNEDMCHYTPKEYDDYRYDGKYFIVIRGKQWIGFYNLNCIEYIEVSSIADAEGRHDK